MGLSIEIAKAFSAHAAWKERLKKAVESGHSEHKPEIVALDTRCGFGKWLHGGTIPAEVKKSADYQDVLRLHAAFHRAAGATLSKALQGQKQDAQADLERGAFAAATEALIAALHRWHRATSLGEAGQAGGLFGLLPLLGRVTVGARIVLLVAASLLGGAGLAAFLLLGHFELVAALAVLAGALVPYFFFAFIISRSIIRPTTALAETMTALTNGHYRVEVPATGRADEIGEIARSVMVLQQQALFNEQLVAEQEEQKRHAAEAQMAALDALAGNFETQVGGVIRSVSSAAAELETASQELTATASETSGQATTVASAAEQATGNVATVASATEELSASSNEIASQMEMSLSVAHKANAEAQNTSAMIGQLAENVASIGEIVALINDIASQTNLLALNATIEAARAGEAGKGFAVVANEVKNLASQTSRATEEISTKIGAVQAGTERAVAAIQSISDVIAQMNAIGSTVAAAVQEQTAATSEIARNIDQAASGTQRVSQAISLVQGAAKETHGAATHIHDAATNLVRETDALNEEVKRFLGAVRSGEISREAEQMEEFVISRAAEISTALDQAVDRGEITLNDLFDENYQKIAGSNPEQFMTRFVSLTDRILPPNQEPALALSDKVVFCVAVDRNGFLPTHNKKFSQPQGPDPVWNAANARNRRFFNDDTGMAAARNTKPVLLQNYKRDTGGGKITNMVDISSPITVKGRHWGALRLGHTV